MNGFLTGNFLNRQFFDGVRAEMLESVIYVDKRGRQMRTEIGLITDFGSIPDAFRNLIDNRGKLIRSFVLHDGLYQDKIEILQPDGTWTKYTADEMESNQLLFESGESVGASELELHTIKLMLDIFGWKAFNEDRKQLAADFKINASNPIA